MRSLRKAKKRRLTQRQEKGDGEIQRGWGDKLKFPESLTFHMDFR
jgi:hypothetical protein